MNGDGLERIAEKSCVRCDVPFVRRATISAFGDYSATIEVCPECGGSVYERRVVVE